MTPEQLKIEHFAVCHSRQAGGAEIGRRHWRGALCHRYRKKKKRLIAEKKIKKEKAAARNHGGRKAV